MDNDFLGLPDDIARLAIQRLLQCDVRWRSHKRRANVWQAVAIALGLGTAVLSSLAAYAVAQQWNDLAIYLALSVAILAPLQAALSANDMTERHRSAATSYELLANDLDRYLNLELGPPMWRGITDGLQELPKTLVKIDDRIESTARTVNHPPFKESEIAAATSRAEKIVEYLRMQNLVIPPREIWST